MVQKQNTLTKTGIVALLACVCCILWGSAIPVIKTGYRLMEVRIAQLGELYAKVPRDAAIMMHINNKKWNLIDINIFLEEHGLNVISLSKKIS